MRFFIFLRRARRGQPRLRRIGAFPAGRPAPPSRDAAILSRDLASLRAILVALAVDRALPEAIPARLQGSVATLHERAAMAREGPAVPDGILARPAAGRAVLLVTTASLRAILAVHRGGPASPHEGEALLPQGPVIPREGAAVPCAIHAGTYEGGARIREILATLRDAPAVLRGGLAAPRGIPALPVEGPALVIGIHAVLAEVLAAPGTAAAANPRERCGRSC